MLPIYPYNCKHNHINYIGYIHRYKKNIFKNRQKQNNPSVNYFYFEERKKIIILFLLIIPRLAKKGPFS